MSFLEGLLLVLILLTPLILCVVVIKLVLMKAGHNKRLPFDISTSRRMPGQGLLTEFNNSTSDLFGHLIMLILFFNIPFIYAATYDFLGIEMQISIWALLSIIFVAAFYTLIKLVRTTKNRNNLRLGLEAEWAVSLELHKIEISNYKVFHDIQCEKFNIDHLIVGPNGVFAIETKGKRKPNNSKDPALKAKEHVVIVNGSVLEFPKYKDSSIVEQAIRQADWASNWLSKAVGEKIVVCPVVTIPGWFVTAVSKPTVPVVPTKALGKQIPKLLGQKLGPEQISRIVYQVNQKNMRSDNLL